MIRNVATNREPTMSLFDDLRGSSVLHPKLRVAGNLQARADDSTRGAPSGRTGMQVNAVGRTGRAAAIVRKRLEGVVATGQPANADYRMVGRELTGDDCVEARSAPAFVLAIEEMRVAVMRGAQERGRTLQVKRSVSNMLRFSRCVTLW